MAYEAILILDPEAPLAAFAGRNERATFSQAAFLLSLGALFHFKNTEFFNEEESARFPLPELQFDGPLHLDEISAFSSKRYGFDLIARPYLRPYDDFLLEEIAHDLIESPSSLKTGSLLAQGIRSPNALVQICAAASQLACFSYSPLALEIVMRSASARYSDIVSDIAEAVLARELKNFHFQTKPAPAEKVKNQCAHHQRNDRSLVLLHGTLPFNQTAVEYWWRPKNDLNSYFELGSRPDIYKAPDFFEWEGGHTIHAREVAAKNFKNWSEAKSFGNMDVIAHSHGGNIAMQASNLGTKINKLILLSCPAQWENYQPNFSNVSQCLSIRTKIDLVLLASLNKNHFPQGAIPELYLPFWFAGHSVTRQSGTWIQNNLDIHVN